MRALITRPLVDARRTADLLRDRGVEPVIEPLFSISTIPAARVDTADAQGFLITSANGARSLGEVLRSDHAEAFALPAYCVGDATAATARGCGFTKVFSADGDVEALAALVRRKARPGDGVLIHAVGTHVAGDLAGMLGADGFTVRRQRLYETRQAVALSRETVDLLATNGVHAALFYSPRTAKIFVDLARKAKVADACANIVAYCLSRAVAEKLGSIPFARVRTAAEPNQDSLLALVDADRDAGVFADAEGDTVMSNRPIKGAKETEGKETASRPEMAGPQAAARTRQSRQPLPAPAPSPMRARMTRPPRRHPKRARPAPTRWLARPLVPAVFLRLPRPPSLPPRRREAAPPTPRQRQQVVARADRAAPENRAAAPAVPARRRPAILRRARRATPCETPPSALVC